MNGNEQHTMISIIRRQFAPALIMLEQVIRRCPDELWVHNPHGHPIWKRVFHALESVDRWFNEFGEYHFSAIAKDITPHFDKTCRDFLTKPEMLDYFTKVRGKCDNAFARMDDDFLVKHTHESTMHTNLDMVLSQIRHVLFNAGCCDEAFAANGVNRIEWAGVKG
jgi:hypothetical protein